MHKKLSRVAKEEDDLSGQSLNAAKVPLMCCRSHIQKH
jgi:hypothetical protein